MLQTGRVQQGPSFCVRSPRGSGAWSSANNTVHLIHQSVQHPHGNGRAAGRPESCLNNGARRRPSSWLKRESHCTGCRLSTGAYSINHYDQSLGWVGQTSTPCASMRGRRIDGRAAEATPGGVGMFARERVIRSSLCVQSREGGIAFRLDMENIHGTPTRSS